MNDFKRIGTELNDLRRVSDNANKQPRQYNRTTKSKKPDVARFKAKYWFIDQNNTTFYSYDRHWSKELKQKVFDPQKGLTKLIRQARKYDIELGRLVTCVIWASLDTRPETENTNYCVEVFRLDAVKQREKFNKSLAFDAKTGRVKLDKLREAYERELKRNSEIVERLTRK